MTSTVYGAGAFHAAAPGWRPVTHKATLYMLARAGFIRVPSEYGRRGRSALGPVVHRYVFEGPECPGPFVSFSHRKRTFRLQWADGCFYPFVWEWRSA